MLRQWEELPDCMRIPEVRPYWEVLYNKRIQLMVKRLVDMLLAWFMLVVFALPMVFIAIVIKADSKGPVFFRQARVTQYGKVFRIHKFRTMIVDAEKKGTGVTVCQDNRVTKAGQKLRKYRLDELPQLLDVICGNMSFVGTRPETVKYVEKYKPEMLATLLLPAGITSEASIHFKDEALLLDNAVNPDEVYIEKVLPQKMKWNLKCLKSFGLIKDFSTMIRTVTAVVKG